MRKILFATLMVIASVAWADNHGSGIALPGMMFKQAIVCTDPYTAKDLFDVINKEEMYFTYLRGYEISGHCQEYNGHPFQIRQKLLPYSNKTFDGYEAQLWSIEIDDYENNTIKNWYAVIFPGAMNVRADPTI